jgi:hypothetical protein
LCDARRWKECALPHARKRRAIALWRLIETQDPGQFSVEVAAPSSQNRVWNFEFRAIARFVEDRNLPCSPPSQNRVWNFEIRAFARLVEDRNMPVTTASEPEGLQRGIAHLPVNAGVLL